MFVISLVYLLSLVLALALGVRLVAAIFSHASRAALLQHPLVHFILVGVVAFIWFAPWGTAAGSVAANIDIMRGHFEIKKCGLSRMPLSIYSRILMERYQVRCPTTSSCMLMPSESEYCNAYNSISVTAINKHYGKDIFEECRIAAEEEFKAKYPTKSGPPTQ